jgi:hypothetical protein
MFSSPGKPSRGGMPAGMGLGRFEALFSDIYDKENNCTSGIAMFMVRTCNALDSAEGRGICHY